MTVYHTVLRGTCGSGPALDGFSHSMGIESQQDAQAVGLAIRDAWVAAMTDGTNGLDQYYTPTTVWNEVTVAQVLDPLVPDLSAAIHVPFTPPVAGLGSGTSLPQQTALAISWTAGQRPNGAPFRGRMYLPAMQTITVGAGGIIDPAVQQNVANVIGVYISAIIQAGHTPSIWSRTVEDLVNPISSIRVGNKFDTIRSRRNDIPETYVQNAI